MYHWGNSSNQLCSLQSVNYLYVARQNEKRLFHLSILISQINWVAMADQEEVEPPSLPTIFKYIQWKWNNLVSMRPNYFILMGYLRKWEKISKVNPHTFMYTNPPFAEILDLPLGWNHILCTFWDLWAVYTSSSCSWHMHIISFYFLGKFIFILGRILKTFVIPDIKEKTQPLHKLHLLKKSIFLRGSEWPKTEKFRQNLRAN